jgi:hypothetical protein
MKVSIITGASLVVAIAINSCAAWSYSYCMIPGDPCPIRGIEHICSMYDECIPKNCFGNQDCTACYLRYRDTFIEDELEKWCDSIRGRILTSKEPYYEPQFCDVNNNFV